MFMYIKTSIYFLIFVDGIEECLIVNLNNQPTVDRRVQTRHNTNSLLFDSFLLTSC